MALPIAVAVLDDFNRTDAPVGSNWSAEPFNNGSSTAFDIVSNVIRNGVVAGSQMWWNPTTYGPDVVVQFTASAVPAKATTSSGFLIFLRLRDPSASSSTCDGYQVEFYDTDRSYIYRIDNGVATQLGATITLSATYASGALLAGCAIGSSISAYREGTSEGSRTDTTYGAEGFIGLGAYDTATLDVRLDDFSVGASKPLLASTGVGP